MKTLKKAWIAPKAIVEEFTPNEYVSACVNVQCELGSGNKVYAKESKNGYVSRGTSGKYSRLPGLILDTTLEHGDPCGKNTVLNLNGSVFETDKDDFQDGGIVSYIDRDKNNVLSAGDYVYWITRAGNTEYHHFGTAYAIDSSNTNLS